MTPALCLTTGSTPSSTALKKRPIRPVSRVLVEPEVEQDVERFATSFTRDLGDGAVGKIGILGFHRHGQ